MDTNQPTYTSYTVRPFGDTNGQHFTLILKNTTEDYYLFYYRFLDADGVWTEGTSYEFLLSILDFLDIDYEVKECDEDLFNVSNYIKSKNKEECKEWIDYVLENLFYDYTKDENNEEEIKEKEDEQ